MSYPCCVYEITDPEKIYRYFKIEWIKDYGAETRLEDGSVLHRNYNAEHWEGGSRSLCRCRRCGALFLNLYSYEYDMYDGCDSTNDWIPVFSEEEADLLNLLTDEKARTGGIPVRHLWRHDWKYRWEGEEEPAPRDPEKLRRMIRERYADADPELLEKLIRKAGKDRAVEKTPWNKWEDRKPVPEEEKSYTYLADFSADPPVLIRLGSFAEMEADMYVYPGIWEDTPRLNDIRVGLGDFMDYDEISEKAAMEILMRKKALYDRIAAEEEKKKRGAEAP